MKFSLEYDMIDHLSILFKRNKKDIKLFLIIFLINIFIFGQKIFFYIVISDDYMRFYGDDNTQMLITYSARWAQALLNDYVFIESLQILPYLHGIIGIFTLTMMGYITAKYFSREKTMEIVVVTLLISATPMFAHNLLFSTNITTWITLLLGVIGFLILQKSNWFLKILGFIFIVFSIGNYQTIIQIIITMIMIKMILEFIQVNTWNQIWRIIFHAIYQVIILLFAYMMSNYINELFLSYHHWHEAHRLAQAEHGITLKTLIPHILSAYHQFVEFNYFQDTFYFLYKLMVLIAGIGVLFTVLSNNIKISIKLTKLLLITLIFLLVPIIINLPAILSVEIPTRAHFSIGWIIAGLFVIQIVTLKKIFTSISYLLSLLIIICSIYYITIFYDVAHRQTNDDIIRANVIVDRIRSDKNYEHDSIGFFIVGQQKHGVTGWKNLRWQQPLESKWAKYKLFKHFTDLKFHVMYQSELKEMQEYLNKRGEKVGVYPAKNSLIVYNNNAILFLYDDKKTNREIEKKSKKNKIDDILTSLPLERKIKSDNQIDRYIFKVKKSGLYSINTRGELDTEVKLYSHHRKYLLAKNNDISKKNKNSSISIVLAKGKTYHLEVSSNGEIGTYILESNIETYNQKNIDSNRTTVLLLNKNSQSYPVLLQKDNKYQDIKINTKINKYTDIKLGDFNGDGLKDLFLRKDKQNIIEYVSLDGNIKKKTIEELDASYKLIGIGDFNTDGIEDLVWRAKNKFIYIWYMNKDGIQKHERIGNLVSSYSRIVGIGDFNGDGISDILWRKGRKYRVWYIFGGNGKYKENIKLTHAKYSKVIGIGDFNADGISDILWLGEKNLFIWYMNSQGKYTTKIIDKAPLKEYKIQQVNDFNADGISDILWKTNKGYEIWKMNLVGTYEIKNF